MGCTCDALEWSRNSSESVGAYSQSASHQQGPESKADLGVPVSSFTRQMLRPGTNSNGIINENGCKQRIATFYLAKMGPKRKLFEHHKSFSTIFSVCLINC